MQCVKKTLVFNFSITVRNALKLWKLGDFFLFIANLLEYLPVLLTTIADICDIMECDDGI